ncbi:YecA/YgfB family protein [Candidatus Pantoea persica]|uniref:YecA/YgfB family protein n=1 Tax=Candidatus Pantoea persica TaxID=2518128 RepID=UPI00215D9FBA|nr:YecA family protein [Candidatus Pantoea persica]MBA2816210.1 yecA family protein [Candidatus Pantoea persica]
MSLPNATPDYNALASTLSQQGVGMTPAEMHGLISGILCGGNQDSSWKRLVHDLTNEGMAFSQGLSLPLQALHDSTATTLENESFLFQLMLPDDDDISVFDRADALAGWVNHFLLGLGVTQPKLDKVTGEAIDDLRTIAQLGYEEDEDQNELEQSLEEVIEYVRVVALLCHDTFNRPQPMPTAPEVKKPTLH